VKAADYLQGRGWCPDIDGDYWADPRGASDTSSDGSSESWGWYGITDAVTVQRARDEEKAREAWVRFAAARLSIGHHGGGVNCEPYTEGAYFTKAASDEADAMLVEYRARFCPEIES